MGCQLKMRTVFLWIVKKICSKIVDVHLNDLTFLWKGHAVQKAKGVISRRKHDLEEQFLCMSSHVKLISRLLTLYTKGQQILLMIRLRVFGGFFLFIFLLSHLFHDLFHIWISEHNGASRNKLSFLIR